MIACTTLFADTASGHSIYYLFIRYFNINYLIDNNSHLIQSLSLRNGSWEAIENETVLAIVLDDSFLNDADNNLIRNKSSRFHIALSLKTHLCAGFQRLTDNVTRRNCGNIVAIADNLGLCALTCTWCSEKYDFHKCTPFRIHQSRKPL